MSAKEAAYKWQGRRGVDFIAHLPIVYYNISDGDYNINIYSNLFNPPMMLSIEAVVEADFTCAYVVKSQEWAIY